MSKKDRTISKMCQIAIVGLQIPITRLGDIHDFATKEYDAGKRDKELTDAIRDFAKDLSPLNLLQCT